MKEYLSFSSKLLIAFGLAFELPLVLTGMARMGLVTDSFLKKNRKYAILLFFIGAAIITPPDVVSQILMALPLMVLYEMSIIGARIFQPKPSDEEADDEADDPTEEAEGAEPAAGGNPGENSPEANSGDDPADRETDQEAKNDADMTPEAPDQNPWKAERDD